VIPRGLEYSQMCQTRSAVVSPVSDTIGLLLCSASNAAANFGGTFARRGLEGTRL